MILVVQNSKELDEQRTLFLESMSLCVSIVKPRTSSHQTIAEALDELQVSPGSSSTQIILLQKRTRFEYKDDYEYEENVLSTLTLKILALQA